MLFSGSDLKGFRVDATDGEAGSVRDLYLDDIAWAVRYVVIEGGTRLSGRKFLACTAVLTLPDLETKRLSLRLSSARLANSPDVEATPSLSRNCEAELAGYFGGPRYWEVCTGGQPRLRSAEDVSGYLVRATDGETGSVSDFLIGSNWNVEYLIVKLRPLLPGGRVVVESRWISGLNAAARQICISLPKHVIQGGPEYAGELLEDQASLVRRYYAAWRAAA
jgi:hypothetical protein